MKSRKVGAKGPEVHNPMHIKDLEEAYSQAQKINKRTPEAGGGGGGGGENSDLLLT